MFSYPIRAGRLVKGHIVSVAGKRVSLLIPTLNGAEDLAKLFESLGRQTFKFHKILLIDSSSSDHGPDLARKNGATVVTIKKSEFDHGRTRQLGIDILGNSDFVVLMTQDAFLESPESIENLLKPFDDCQVGMVYGRQLPRPGAGLIEAHARLFNYKEDSYVVSKESSHCLGLKAIFCSNSFSAYRIEALRDVGGFPSRVILGEDTIVAGRMLRTGWKKAYAGQATAFHSHSYTIAQEFRRCFDIGVLHAQEAWLCKEFGGTSGEGFSFVVSELKYLLRRNPFLIPSAMLRTFAKFTAYKLGTNEKNLPLKWKVKFSMHKNHWNKPVLENPACLNDREDRRSA